MFPRTSRIGSYFIGRYLNRLRGERCGAYGVWGLQRGLAGLEIDRLSGGHRGACGAWPGFETTRRAEGSCADGERAGRPRGGRHSHRWQDPKAPEARMSTTNSLVTRNKM